MNTTMTSSAAYRPRGFKPEVLAKIIRAEARSVKRAKIERIRTALATIVDSLEREWAARKRASCGAGDPSSLLIEALNASADFDELAKELGHG